jgi:regulator of protease activity HflC (stomatin/prohibitin superfamily)
MEDLIIPLAVGAAAVVGLISSVKVVPQTQNFLVERFGKYRATLNPGLHFILPGVDAVRHKVSILERQLPEYPIEAITSDNGPISVSVATFFRVIDSHKCVYRITDIDRAVQSLVTGAVRSAIGEVDFDSLQSNRSSVNKKLEEELKEQADEWGIEITRSEIMDVNFDERTRESLQQQINAERERRAVVTRAEGDKRAIELKADGELYGAQKEAEARKVRADAEAYATEIIAKAIGENGDDALRFDMIREQISAMKEIAKAPSAKTIVMPSEMTSSLTGLAALATDFMGQIPQAKAATDSPFKKEK